MESLRSSLCSTATEDDLSIAISSANFGKMVAIRGLEELEVCRVGALTWMVVMSFWGWLREMESSLLVAEREYSDWEVAESRQMISWPASRSSLPRELGRSSESGNYER